MSSTDLESSETSRAAREQPPAPHPKTIVGLAPPEPPLAGATEYDDPSLPLDQQTLVGFPGPPPSSDSEPELPLAAAEFDDDAPDEVTTVGGYDEVTVVTPSNVLAIVRAVTKAKAEAGPRAAPASVLEMPPEPLPDTLRQSELQGSVEPLPETLRQAELLALAEPPPDTVRQHELELPLEALRDSAPPELGPAWDSVPDTVPAEQASDLAVVARSLSKPPPPPPRPHSVAPRHETRPPPSSDRNVLSSPSGELRLFAPPVEMFGPGHAASLFEGVSVEPAANVGIQSDAPWYRPAEPEVSTTKRAGSRALLVGLVVTVLAAAAAVSGVFLPKAGRVLVTVSGPLDAPVRDAVVLVDGKRACAPAPCRTTLERGAHVLSVLAPSYRRPAEKALSLSPGAEEALHFTLAPDDSAAIDVRGPVAGLRVVVDGLERGTTPLTVRGLRPGKHSVSVDGSTRYSPFETELELEADRVTMFEPKLALVPEAEPITATELPTKGNTTGTPAPAAHAPTAWRPPRTLPTSAPVLPAAVDLDAPDPTLAGGVTLSIKSNPVSNVVVDGRPLGATPREISVAPG